MTKQQEGYPQGQLREYVPSWDPNQVVFIRTPTLAVRRKINAAITKGIKLSVGDLKKIEGKSQEEVQKELEDRFVVDMHADFDWQELAVRTCVESFKFPYENLGATAKDGKEFAEYGETTHLTELADEIYGEASLDAEEKKSSSRSSKRAPKPRKTRGKKKK